MKKAGAVSILSSLVLLIIFSGSITFQDANAISESDFQFLLKFGSKCNINTEEGCIDPDGTSGPLQLGDGQFSFPTGVAVDLDGNIVVADRDNQRIQVFDSSGNFLFKFGTSGSGNGEFGAPHDVEIDHLSGNIYVVDLFNDRVQVFDSSGNYLFDFGEGVSGQVDLNLPRGIEIVEEIDRVYVADTINHIIQIFDLDGNFVDMFGGECYLLTNPPSGNCVDPDGGGPLELGDGQFFRPQDVVVDKQTETIFVIENNQRVQVFDSNFNFISKFGRNVPNFETNISFPTGLALDDSGNVFVGEHREVSVFDNAEVHQFNIGSACTLNPVSPTCEDPDGSGPLELGDGQFDRAHDVELNDMQNKIVVSDRENHRIQLFGSLLPPKDSALPIAADGNRVAVGHCDNPCEENEFRIILHNMTTGQEMRIFSDPTPIDNLTFGHYIDIEGNFLVVTESYDEISPQHTEFGAYQLNPRVYVFNTQTGDLTNTIVIPDDTDDLWPNWAPWSISLDEGLITVGGVQEQWHFHEPFVQQSSAHVFDAATGQMLYSLQSPPLSGAFGWATAIDGNTVLVGDRYFDGGRIYVYDLTACDAGSPAVCQHIGVISPPQGIVGFGSGLEINGDVVATSGSDFVQSLVFLYDLSLCDFSSNQPCDPVRIFEKPDPEQAEPYFPHTFGGPIKIHENFVVVSDSGDGNLSVIGFPEFEQYADLDRLGPGAGVVYVFDLQNHDCVVRLEKPNRIIYDFFGRGMDVDSNKIVVGSARGWYLFDFPGSCIDADGDGIADNADTNPTMFSNSFSDSQSKGITFGSIVSRGNQELIISDIPRPGGLRIVSEESGGSVESELTVCDEVAITLGAGNDFTVTCQPETQEITPKKIREQQIPEWIKKLALWWATEKVSDSEFLEAIQYLIKNGHIRV